MPRRGAIPPPPSPVRRRSCDATSAAGCACGAFRRSISGSTSRWRIRIASSRFCAIFTRKRRSAPLVTRARRARTLRGMTTTTAETTAAHVAAEIQRRQRFVVASHARPAGDALRSSLATALALERLGKEVRVISRDRVPPQMQMFAGVDSIEVVDRVEDTGDAVIVLECGDAQRTGVAGLERGYVINIDHHPGNTLYGAVNWLDLSAAACGEMVFELIGELGVALTPEIATHVYIAILTDTGAFHYSNITPRTFDICRQCVEAGVNAPAVARSIFDSNNLARLKLYGAVLHTLQLDPSGRIATVYVDQRLARECGGTYED